MAVVFCFGAYSILQSIWNIAKVLVAGHPMPPPVRKKIDAGTQTFPTAHSDLKETRIWFTKQGAKWHLYENCFHIDTKDKMSRDGLCATCSESYLLHHRRRKRRSESAFMPTHVHLKKMTTPMCHLKCYTYCQTWTMRTKTISRV